MEQRGVIGNDDIIINDIIIDDLIACEFSFKMGEL